MQLPELHRRLWQMLEHAVSDSGHGFYTGVLANAADARIVVLRSASREAAHILFYSDRRAPKIAALHADPCATLVVYAAPCQLRVRGRISIHVDDSLSDEYWARCPLSSRRAYLASAAPGSPLLVAGSGLPSALDTRAPTAEESTPGRANFAVLRLAIDEIDCLLLEASGHRRAAFRRQGTTLVSEWRIP